MQEHKDLEILEDEALNNESKDKEINSNQKLHWFDYLWLSLLVLGLLIVISLK